MLRRVLSRVARRTGITNTVNRYLEELRVRNVSVNGVPMRIPSIRGMSCGPTEPWMIGLLSEVLQQNSGAFLDVGVNLGQTLVKLRALDWHRPYIGFEPNPVCVTYVQDLIKANGFKNCILLPVGLFTRDAILPLDLYEDDPADSMASLVENFRSDRKVHSRSFVPVFTFGSIGNLLEGMSISVVKIDVEGSELEVVRSISGLMARDRPYIAVEVLPVYSEDNIARKHRQEELERLLSDANYTILRVEKTASDGYGGLRRVEKIGIHSDLTQCDYLAVPKEREASLKVLDEGS